MIYKVEHLSGVLEGYSVDRTAPIRNGQTDVVNDVEKQTQIFQSSRDINHRVLRNWTPSPFSSPKKRTRCDYEVEEEDERDDMEIDPVDVTLQNPAESILQRPIKPLRRTLFTSTASKPSLSQNRADHDTSSRSENPFFE